MSRTPETRSDGEIRPAEPVSVEPPLTLVLHADAFRPHERAALMEGLAQLDPAPEESTDGGEWLLAYTVR